MQGMDGGLTNLENGWRSDVRWQLRLVAGGRSSESLDHELLSCDLLSIRKGDLLAAIHRLLDDTLDPLKCRTHVLAGAREGDGILQPPLLVRVVHQVVGDRMGAFPLSILLELQSRGRC